MNFSKTKFLVFEVISCVHMANKQIERGNKTGNKKSNNNIKINLVNLFWWLTYVYPWVELGWACGAYEWGEGVV